MSMTAEIDLVVPFVLLIVVTQAHRHRCFINTKDRVSERATDRERERREKVYDCLRDCENLMHKTSVIMTI